MTVSGAERLLAAKKAKAEQAGIRHLQGVPVNNIDGPFDIKKMKLPFPVFGCVCVQDSPQNPCPCKDVIIWLPTFPKVVTKTGRQNESGSDVLDFGLSHDAVVLVDMQMRVSLAALQSVTQRARRRKQSTVVVRSAGSPETSDGEVGRRVRDHRTRAVALLDKGWLGFAAAAGYAIGGVLDDLAGSNEGENDNLSDDISDWAAENFPAPDWLQDIGR